MAIYTTTSGGDKNIENVYLADGTVVDNVFVTSASGNKHVFPSGSSPTTPPEYDMFDPIILWNGIEWIPDKNGATSHFNGELSAHTVSGDYPKNGTLKLHSNTLNTHYQVKVGNGIYGIYDVSGSNYKIYAIHLKAGDKADIYLGAKGTPIALSESDKAYTIVNGDWIITETPPAIIIPAAPSTKDTYINFDESGNVPSGIIVNTIAAKDMSDAPSDYLDSIGNVTGISTSLDKPFNSGLNGVDGHATCFGNVEFVKRGLMNWNGTDTTMSITLPSGTFSILLLSSFSGSDTTLSTGTFTVDGVAKTIDASINNTGSHCAEWTNINGGRVITLVNVNTAGNSYINAIRIRKDS